MPSGGAHPVERLHVSVNTPAGEVHAPLEVPSGFVPVTSIVPSLRDLGERATALEQSRAEAGGRTISCRMGCAACCRMLVPVSPPEAFALHDVVQSLPESQRRQVQAKLEASRARLEETGLWARLTEIADTDRQLSDEDMEQTNRDYYALRLPCPFLENEACSIYPDRPAACRELLVTSPADLCQDIVKNPVRPIPVPVRIGTVLGMLWAELAGGPVRLIPLPVALSWAARHGEQRRRRWKGPELLEKAMDKVWRYLSREFESRGRGRAHEGPS